jgi:hypothetical protein
MLRESAHPRISPAISPAFILGIILLGVCVIEALLVTRLWLFLAAVDASEGMSVVVLDLTAPLVAPFSEEPIRPSQIGSLDRGALIAAGVYLAGAVGLMALTMLARVLLAANTYAGNHLRRGRLLRTPHAGTRLLGTASLNLSPRQAVRALRLLRLDRLSAELFVIPAAGGCIVAAFGNQGAGSGLPVLGRLRANQDAVAVKRAFRQIEQRFQSEGPSPLQPEASAPHTEAAREVPIAASNY